MKTIILIDFENIQPKKDLVHLRGREFITKVFCGANQTKIPLKLAAEIQALGPTKAEYIQIESSGKNALDFLIAYYVGRLVSESPAAVFYIVSKDTGFDPLIKYLKTQNIACHRISSLSVIPTTSRATTSSPDRIQKVADRLLQRSEGRPLTRKTLIAFIKAQLNAHATEAAVAEVVERLNQGGVSILPNDKVSYPLI